MRAGRPVFLVTPYVKFGFRMAVPINQGVAQGVRFGPNPLFTFGPYASVYTWQYHLVTGRSCYQDSLLWTQLQR